MKLEYVVEVQCDRDVQKFEIKDTIWFKHVNNFFIINFICM